MSFQYPGLPLIDGDLYGIAYGCGPVVFPYNHLIARRPAEPVVFVVFSRPFDDDFVFLMFHSLIQLQAIYVLHVHEALQAAALFLRAAEHGFTEAQLKLAAMLDRGDGIEEDASEAFFWYYRLAKQKVVSAQYRVGCMAEQGRGVYRDEKEAASWFKKAAHGGHAEAALNLAQHFARGRGVPKKPVDAYMYLLMYMGLLPEGQEPVAEAIKLKTELERQMRPRARAAARDAAARFLKERPQAAR